MRIVKECKITNVKGDSIEFGRHFKLKKDIDLSGLAASVNYAESNSDGASLQNTMLDIRDIAIEAFIHRQHRDEKWIEDRRKELMSVLNPKFNPMKMEFKTASGEEYYVNLNIEGTPSFPTGFENANRTWQIFLLDFTCGDPRIYSSSSIVEEIATWIPNFEFDFELSMDGIEISYRTQSLIKNVFNGGTNDVGLIIEFKANATVVKPSLINVNTYETLELDTTMQPGDTIRVNTTVGQKYVTLIRSNVASDAFHTITLDSVFLQLEPGDNLFRYDAADGIDNLTVKMEFTSTFVGV